MSSFIDPLLQDLARCDFLTYQHSIAVAELMKSLATKLNLEDQEIQNAETLGAIHDLGKTKVPTDIFKKLQAGQIASDEERELLKKSSVLETNIINPDLLDPKITEALVQIDCRYDGKDSPDLKGESISLFSRMLKVCNYYDMLIRQRTGRTPLTEEQSKQVLKNNSGILFDPILVSLFIDQ